ncbi:MAG TPA: YciI family protein [Telluria sp.]|nr:YciI family protein [Telluria sp.]
MIIILGLASLAVNAAHAQGEPMKPASQYDGTLAASLGGDGHGMRAYVLVILKTGPTKVPAGEARKAMFAGHFANMERLAAEKKLAFAGPLDGVEGRRGIFILATPDIETAKIWVATDPVIVNGEMVAEYHKLYGSAALMMVNDVHNKIQKKQP